MRTVPKDIGDLWVFGDNRRYAKKFTLIVDDSVEEGDYKYGVSKLIAGCIDPRISVKKSDTATERGRHRSELTTCVYCQWDLRSIGVCGDRASRFDRI